MKPREHVKWCDKMIARCFKNERTGRVKWRRLRGTIYWVCGKARQRGKFQREREVSVNARCFKNKRTGRGPRAKFQRESENVVEGGLTKGEVEKKIKESQTA